MWIKHLTRNRSDLAPVETALRLTAVYLLLRPMGPWGVRPLILGLAGLALILPRVLRAPATWYGLAALIAARIIADWPLPDNHIYLLAYWCLAVALALGAKDSVSILGKSSRMLIGLAFLMAVLWKGLLSPDYLDGRFFRVTLLTDDRLADAALLLGGLTGSELDENRVLLRPLQQGAELLDSPPLAEPPAFRLLTTVSTWGGIVLEALIACACLAPLSGHAVKVRHILLLSFCVVTYAFAPVAGFGWLLLVMGLCSCQPEQRLMRITYITAWFVVLFYSEIPWAGVIVDWLGVAF
jgi:hypothetical protein